MNQEHRHSVELPFAVRLQMLRRSRRRMTFHRLTDNALWVAFLAAMGIFVATGLIAAIGRA